MAYSERMKKAVKAALLSGLVFPGLGHLSIKQRLRGWALIATALAALSIMAWIATQQALTVVDSIMSGDTAVGSASIEEMVEATSSAAEDSVANVCLLVLGACWLFAIVDGFRLGAVEDRLTGPAN